MRASCSRAKGHGLAGQSVAVRTIPGVGDRGKVPVSGASGRAEMRMRCLCTGTSALRSGFSHFRGNSVASVRIVPEAGSRRGVHRHEEARRRMTMNGKIPGRLPARVVPPDQAGRSPVGRVAGRAAISSSTRHHRRRVDRRGLGFSSAQPGWPLRTRRAEVGRRRLDEPRRRRRRLLRPDRPLRQHVDLDDAPHLRSSHRVDVAGTGLEGGLAETWEVSDDNLTYTFHLRETELPRWHACTAEDVVSASTELSKGEESGWAFLFSAVDAAQGLILRPW